jgi:hypothetical protein
MRIVGLGHVRISSSNINEPTLTLVAQPNPEELVLELEDIARSRGALQGAQLP